MNNASSEFIEYHFNLVIEILISFNLQTSFQYLSKNVKCKYMEFTENKCCCNVLDRLNWLPLNIEKNRRIEQHV